MRQFVRVFFALALIVTTSVACAQSDRVNGAPSAAASIVIIEAETGDHRFDVELADDNEERRMGLMYRESLAPDAGMLFDFETTQPVSMWMKNTLIPLDMAFIDENGVIQRIAPMTTPRSLQSVASGAPVMAVLEVNGGTFERLGVKRGDIVRHPIFDQ